MESETKQTYPCINGLSKPPSESQMVEKRKGNFRLLKDPFLDDKVQKKVYRFDGLVPGGQTIDLKDPRRRSNPRSNPRYRLWSSRQVLDLDVPRFKYDQNYIGTPPPNEVTFTNLNDNIDSKFLGNMCRQFGTIEEIKIYHHPKTKKHMGIGKVLFTFSKCAKACVDKLHQTSKMGNIINVMIDTMGKERNRIIEEMLADKPKNTRRPVPPPERIDPRSHGRLYAAASTSSNRPVASCNYPPTKNKYNDYGLEAYDPGDTEFDFGNASGHRQLVNTSMDSTSYTDSDYGSLQHCDSGYSVTQSEMSFSGHSDISTSSYESYNQYSSQHASGNRGWSCAPHAAPYSSYSVQQQYAQHNSSRHVATSYSQQHQQHYSHSNYDSGHQPCPPPEPTTHSHAESSSRSHSYSERRDEYKDRSTSSVTQHHWEKEREREINSREKCREKEHRIRPKTPEPEEPRNQSLESRLQSIFGLGGLGSPTESNRSKDHSSPSSTPRSRDEMCTPSPGVDSRYVSSQQYPVSTRASSSGSCSSHVLQMPPLPQDNDEETKLPLTPTTKGDSSDRLDYSRESSSRSKRFELKNSLDHSDNITHYDQLKADKVISAVASSSSVGTSRYKSESNDDNSSNGFLSAAASGDFTSINQKAKCFATSVVQPLPKHMPVEEKSEEKEENVDMEIDEDDADDDDDDDRMSLSSISSGEEKLEVNVQLPSSDGKFTTNNFQSMSTSQASRTAPPVPLITDFSRPPPGMPPWSFSSTYSFGSYPTTTPARMDLATGTFNQSYSSQIPGSLGPINYTGQSLTDSSLSQLAAAAANSSTGGRGGVGENQRQEEVLEEKDPNDKTFLFVLDHFVRELKEVMQKDLCKKMVENSAFKSFELWWDTEEQKSKFQKGSGSNEKAVVIKDTTAKESKSNSQQPGSQLTSGRNDALASLFETQHPWRQEGGFEAHYGGAHGGGFLGIRGVMPRMPSFKKKVFRPPSPPPPDDEDSKAAESFASNAEDDESDDDVIGSSPSIRKKNVYASDEESASEDEKSDATASEDEEASDESSDEESDEEASDETSDTSEEGSEEEEEEEEETEAKTKNEIQFTSDTKTFSISESEKTISTNEIKDQTSVGESDFKAETRKIQEYSLRESSSETESDIEDSERDTTESSSDAEPDQSVLFKPQLSPIKEEEEQEEFNKEDKCFINEKSSVSTEPEKTKLSTASGLNARTDSDITCKFEQPVDAINWTTDISSDDQGTSSSSAESKKASSQLSSTTEDSTETLTTRDEEVSSTEVSSEVTATDEEMSKTDRSKAYVIPAIAEHDYVAMPPPLPVGPEIRSSEEFDHIEEEPEEGEVVDDDDDSDRTESCDEDNTPLEILMDHNYCLPPAIGEVHEDSEMPTVWPENKIMSEKSLKDTLLDNSAANAAVQDVVQKLAAGNLTVDEHAAAATAAVVAAAAATVSVSQAAAVADNQINIRSTTKKKKKHVKDKTLTDITNKSVNEYEAGVKPIVKPKIQFQPRSYQEDKQLFFDIYNKGIDQEDINYLKRTYETLLQSEDPMYDWLNDIFWVDHTNTYIPDPVPPKKKRKIDEQITPVHKTGSARTEGFYKISTREKAGYLNHVNKAAETGQQNEKKLSMTSREARHNIRRFQTNFGDLELGELFKFNQLKFRKKQLRFAKSSIHDWGLFALEPIAAEEMVIEYVGQVIRHFVADEREKQYGAQGIGSSYLFRVDNETIIDATKAGNLARFINHSCNPNCYAKIITVEAHKKIVIYSKRDIDVNEEITYDYKFPLEEEKISCLCGAQGCKGTLN